MRAVVILACALYESVLVGASLPPMLFPDSALVVSIVAGLRPRPGALAIPILAGLLVGALTAEPWAMKPLACVVAYGIAMRLRRSMAAESTSATLVVAGVATLVTAAVEILWRLVVPSLTIDAHLAVGLVIRALISGPVVLIFSRALPGRQAAY